MPDLGRILISVGLLLVFLGAVVFAFNRLHLPLGHLPGDFTWRGQGWSFYFPLGTSILLSLLLTILLWILGRFRS